MIEQTSFKTIVIESLQYKREIGLSPECKEKLEFIAKDWRGGYIVSLPIHSSTGDHPTLAGSFGSVSSGVTAPLLWVLAHAKFCLCLARVESLFPPVLWKSYNQILLVLKARFPGESQSFCQIPRLGSLAWGSEPSQQWRTSLVLLFSGLWITQPMGMRFDFVMIVPLLPSCCGFFFAFGSGIFFFFLVGSSIILSLIVQQLVEILVFCQKEVSAPFYNPPH